MSRCGMTGRSRLLDLIAKLLFGSLLVAHMGGCALAAPKDCKEDIPTLYERVSPSVVMISGQSINPYKLQDRVSRVIGSGFIFDREGLILTNSHVAFGRQTLYVSMDDGRVLPAKLIGADPIFDIAVIEIPKPDHGTLPTAILGDSDKVRIGEEVIAIGNPLGLDQTVTRGIISGLNRILPETPLSLSEPLIQTDAPINPGNSGGPLLNRCGQVIGINSAIIPNAQNIGFAIPSNLLKSVASALMKDGRVIRPWIGFHGSIVGPDVRKVLNLPMTDGLLVEVVEPGSPAEAAGIRGGRIEFTLGTISLLLGGDIVTHINDAPTTDPEKLAPILHSLKVGSRVKLTLFREGETRDLEYVLPERPLLPGDLPAEQAETLSPSNIPGRRYPDAPSRITNGTK
ncbi:MAG TPA: trypsin-like peptidase domain-containing protein [Burkholderiales bacterium]|nr:trypsin-like peptidase domain-containing protein [Burkholderiales bacterium]